MTQSAAQKHIHPAGENHQVVTIVTKDEKFLHRREPCPECPWRRDAPIGEFPAEAYRHSANTAHDMSTHIFSCHMSGAEKTAACAGFLIKGATHNLSVRINAIHGYFDRRGMSVDIPLYESYRQMAEANGVAPDDPALKLCRD